MGVWLFCNTCQTEKSIGEFYQQPDSKTGRMSQCKECILIKRKIYRNRNKEIVHACKNAWYSRNKERAREQIYKWKKANPMYMKFWHQQNTDKNTRNGRAWRARHPHYVKCHKQYRLALKTGDIVRPGHCMICNTEGKIEGHHHDYSKPLNVVWVCKKCHSDIHGKHRLIGMK